MPLDQVENFVEVNVAGDHNSTETTISLESGEASNLPDPSSGEFNLVWFDSTNFSRPSEDNNVEIVRVTGRDTTNDTITVLRGQENTTAVSHDTANSDYVMILAQTAKMIEDVDAADFSTNSLTVAGNSVTLGSSTEVDYIDLNDTGNSFPIPNADLSNSSVSIAGNNVALGGSTNINYVDLNDTGTSFPIPNSDLGNSSLTVAGNNVVLGGSTSVNHSDISNIDADDHHTRYSDEEAQDAVGTILNADFNYDDGGNSITLASNSLTVGNTTISLGSSGTPTVTNLDGSSGNSGQFLQTDGSSLSFADVSSFSGDHADLENVDSGQHHSKVTPDGSTIVTDSNGNFKVAPQTTVLGDFENNSKGTWTGGFSLNQDQGGAQSSVYYLYGFTQNVGETITETRSFDLTGFQSLVVYYKINPRRALSRNGGSSDQLEVIVNSITKATINAGQDTDWKKIEMDVSSISGSVSIDLKVSNNSGTSLAVGYDRILAKSTTAGSISSNKAGGV